jgi:anti-sigma factor RsiW
VIPRHEEKVVAGLSCGAVLSVLSDYLDGDLPPRERERVEEHLRGCDGCARFGGQFRNTVRALRDQLGRGGGALPASVRERLRAALEDEE